MGEIGRLGLKGPLGSLGLGLSLVHSCTAVCWLRTQSLPSRWELDEKALCVWLDTGNRCQRRWPVTTTTTRRLGKLQAMLAGVALRPQVVTTGSLEPRPSVVMRKLDMSLLTM
jgi:hypothetical protein